MKRSVNVPNPAFGGGRTRCKDRSIIFGTAGPNGAPEHEIDKLSLLTLEMRVYPMNIYRAEAKCIGQL